MGYTYLAIGTVTSVSMTVPTGLTVGSPDTAGTFALSLTSGYSIPTPKGWNTDRSLG